MGISFEITRRIDDNFAIGNVPRLPPRTLDKPREAPDRTGGAFDGRRVFYSADGDRAEIFNSDAAHADAPHSSAVSKNALPDNAMGGSHNFANLFFSRDGDRAEISFPRASNKNADLPASATSNAGDAESCAACENRKYVDGSDDPSVSFKTPTKLNAGTAATAVAAHEYEHVRNEQQDAERENRKITHQSVTFHYDTCPDCGKNFIAGGTTRTTSVEEPESEAYNAAAENKFTEQAV